MIVYKVQLEGYNGPCVHDSIESAIEEIKSLLEEEDNEQVVTISQVEMTQEELDAMGEFGGY
jgi:hypothetical protein